MGRRTSETYFPIPLCHGLKNTLSFPAVTVNGYLVPVVLAILVNEVRRASRFTGFLLSARSVAGSCDSCAVAVVVRSWRGALNTVIRVFGGQGLPLAHVSGYSHPVSRVYGNLQGSAPQQLCIWRLSRVYLQELYGQPRLMGH